VHWGLLVVLGIALIIDVMKGARYFQVLDQAQQAFPGPERNKISRCRSALRRSVLATRFRIRSPFSSSQKCDEAACSDAVDRTRGHWRTGRADCRRDRRLLSATGYQSPSDIATLKLDKEAQRMLPRYRRSTRRAAGHPQARNC
jgi:hypothetical protein